MHSWYHIMYMRNRTLSACICNMVYCYSYHVSMLTCEDTLTCMDDMDGMRAETDVLLQQRGRAIPTSRNTVVC